MPAKDVYHDTVVAALRKDGWDVIDENITIPIGRRWGLIDIAAESHDQTITILVEVKSFLNSQSAMERLANALGKYLLYHLSLSERGISASLYLAVPDSAYNGIFSDRIGQLVIDTYQLRLIVFDPENEEITRWLD